MLYFDHNSTTPVDARVADAFDQATREHFGNASSIHLAGQAARARLDAARRGIAKSLGAHESEIIFTSGGTESNNLAIKGVLTPGSHVVTSVIEHPAVLEPVRRLEQEGVRASYVTVGSHGRVDAGEVERAIRPNTALISLMAANNETGAIQPLKEVAEVVRKRRLAGQKIIFHSDGVQAAGKMELNLHECGVDLFSISSHKVYAPKGFGLLYVRNGVQLKSLHLGGQHERGMRAGTQNVAGAIALDAALGLCSADERLYLATLRDEFERVMRLEAPMARVNAAGSPRLPNTSNIFFRGVSAFELLVALDMQGMCVSTGSACSSGSVEPSHVLLEMGLSLKGARQCVRFSFGRRNSLDDVRALAKEVCGAVSRMREKQLV